MSTRKSPYEHTVKPKHPRFSDKVRRNGFTRGKGKPKRAPIKRKINTNTLGNPTGFNVSIFFTDKPRETVNVGENNFTAGTRAGLEAMRTGEVPIRMQIRRRFK